MTSTETFRAKLAGAIDPNRTPQAGAEQANIREEAIAILVLLARHYNRASLDAKKLWERISSAIEVALSRADQDLEVFAAICLEHVLAEPSAAAADDSLMSWLATVRSRDATWRAQFLHTIATRRIPLLVFARQRWQAEKETRAAGSLAAIGGGNDD